MRYFYALLLVLVLEACQTSQLEQYNQIHLGMDKSVVLDVMGSPQRNDRWKGRDRWVYVFYENNRRYEKEVHFSNEKVVYVGDRYRPQVTAESVDAQREAANQNIERSLEERKAEVEAPPPMPPSEEDSDESTTSRNPQMDRMGIPKRRSR